MSMTLADMSRLQELSHKYETFEETKTAIETEFPGVTVTRTETGFSITTEEDDNDD
jgi:hypothetical protein